MSDQATAKRALAYLIGELRPDWTNPDETEDLRLKAIIDALSQTSKALADLALDALDAARNPDLKSPRILVTHRAPDRPVNPRSQQPPQIERCRRCQRVLEPGIEHACRSQRPAGWNDYQAFWRANLAKQRTLREAIANDPGNYELAVTNRAQIAELKNEVEARAAQLDNELEDA